MSAVVAVASLFLTVVALLVPPVGAILAPFLFGLFLLALVGVLGGLGGLEKHTARQYNPSTNPRSWRDCS